MVTNNERGIVLASGSPRRKELLEQLGFRVVVAKSNVPEVRGAGEDPAVYTRRLAEAKARSSAARADATAPPWVLAADTIVVCDGEVLEKPADAADAQAMLRRLSGRGHTVITSFCWMHRLDDRCQTCTVATEVWFRDLSADLIARYVATGEPMDKAGAYGIQGLGAAFCREIRGSYSGVVGLPVSEVVETLEQLGGLTGFPFDD